MKYNIDSLKNKQEVKQNFLQNAGINGKNSLPLIGMISRMTEQKGFDLLIRILEDYL
jgi:starch synthase